MVARVFSEIGMSDYRRCYVPGGSYFFTVVTERRAGILANDKARDCLREAIRHCRQHLPFRVDALVMLPDHIHAIWTLPVVDCDYSKRWGIVKKHFTQPRRVRIAYLLSPVGYETVKEFRNEYGSTG
jgi:REP element-mobilizing transposase RayT